VELFFRWIKQHLRIKAFYGTSENAVKTQAWVALSVYVLVAIVKKQLGLDLSLYKILQILSVTVFERTPIFRGVFSTSGDEITDAEPCIQLKSIRLFNGTALFYRHEYPMAANSGPWDSGQVFSNSQQLRRRL